MSLLQTDSCRIFLAEELARRIESNPRYSLRSFAKKLGLSPGELSEVLRGKRELSTRSALKIARSLDLNPTETKHLLFLTQLEKSKKVGAKQLLEPSENLPQRQLSLDYFNIVSNWPCFAILNLADCDGFQFKVSWIAKRLGLSTQEVRVALERLNRVGILLKNERGQYSIAKEYILSPSEVSAEALKKYHTAILTKAIQALDLQASSEREMTTVGFAVDPKHLPSIKKDIAEFVDQLVQKFQSGKRTEVYQCHVSLFRLTEGTP